MNYWAIAVSAVVAFVASAIYYTVFAAHRARLSPATAGGATRSGPAQMLTEILRNLVLTLVVGASGAALGSRSLDGVNIPRAGSVRRLPGPFCSRIR